MNFARLWGHRRYRFDGERENHAEQAAQTEVSLGLMAVAAQHSDDEHRIQAMQTEHTLRSRQAVLEANRAERGLTQEERGELESIRRGLAGLDTPVSLESHGPRTLAEFGPVEAPRRFLGGLATGAPWLAILMSPLTWIAMGMAAFGLQTARLNHAKADLAQARADTRQAVAIAHDWEERAEHYRQGLIDAANVAHQAAAALDAERAAQARAAARERRRNREIANVLAHSPEPPAWRLRDNEPAEDQPAAPTP